MKKKIKIKLTKEDNQKYSKDIFDFINRNELGVLYGGTQAYTKYLEVPYTNYTESTYVNRPLPPLDIIR